MTHLPIRTVTEDEYPDFVRAVAFQFGEEMHPDDIPVWRSVTDLDRTRAAFDGDHIVATADAYTFSMGVPGQRTVGCGGLTAVGVHTTYRRQGLLAALMREHFLDVRDRGEPVSALYASEAPIYGRFGYGPAAPTISFSVRLERAAFLDPGDLVREVRFADQAADRSQLVSIYEAAHRTTPGLMGRTSAHWELLFGHDEERHRDGYGPLVVALLPDRGYVTYRIKTDWSDGAPAGELRVVELVARDPDAYAALWQLCFSVDLVAKVTANLRPPDDPLPFLLADHTGVVARAGAPLYVRLLDLPKALESRGYETEDALVLEVEDPSWPDNTGRWRVEAGPDGAACERTDDPADLALDATALATVYLGGVRMSRLGRARCVSERTPGALRRADALFSADPLPWNARIF